MQSATTTRMATAAQSNAQVSRLRFRLGDIVRVILLFAAASFDLPPEWIPLNPDWSNYRAVFTTIPFEKYILNSAWVTLAIVLGNMFTAALAGYAFARLNFPGRELLFWLVLATMMIPLQATIIPVFVLISKLGLADTRASLILPALSSAFGTFLMRQYFRRIPNEFEEAALLDGASQWQV